MKATRKTTGNIAIASTGASPPNIAPSLPSPADAVELPPNGDALRLLRNPTVTFPDGTPRAGSIPGADFRQALPSGRAERTRSRFGELSGGANGVAGSSA